MKKALVLSTNEDLRRIIGVYIKNGIGSDSILVETPLAAKAALGNEKIDFAVLDLALPSVEFSDLLIEIQSQWPSLPVFIMTDIARSSFPAPVQTDRLQFVPRFNFRGLTKSLKDVL
jgi:DNA-binding NtrC family response regulator